VKPAFDQGSTVKLTDRYATALSKSRGNPRRWIGRKGMVVSCGKDAVCIIWEGRKSLDYVPLKGVELASL
jgi:hypothetical protein